MFLVLETHKPDMYSRFERASSKGVSQTTPQAKTNGYKGLAMVVSCVGHFAPTGGILCRSACVGYINIFVDCRKRMQQNKTVFIQRQQPCMVTFSGLLTALPRGSAAKSIQYREPRLDNAPCEWLLTATGSGSLPPSRALLASARCSITSKMVPKPGAPCAAVLS